MSLKKHIYELVEKGEHGKKYNRYFDYFILTLILLSVLAIILESIPEVEANYGSHLRVFNTFTIIIFTLEYLMRLLVSDLTHPSTNRWKAGLKFIFSGYGLIDLLAIIPFYLPMLIAVDLRFLRVLRLTRFLRLFKANRYNDSLTLIWSVIKSKRSELYVTGFVTFLLLISASFLMYYVEREAQPEAFPNVLAAIWWAIVTLTTVGYGDVFPITTLGKVISSFIALLGIGIVALPTGIISAGFMAKVKEQKPVTTTTCPHCGETITHHEK